MSSSSARGPGPRVGGTFGRYRIDHVIGVGGMGTVFAAEDTHLDRKVALKVVLGEYAESPEFLRRFQREAAALAKLDSPHVVGIYDHGEHEGWPYIVTQYAGGGDLGRLLRDRGAMPPQLAARLCAQVADALSAAHTVGVVHRDVKPPNVLLRDERLDRLHVYLCDFGVALTETSGMTSAGAVAGTWNYMAPERSRGEHGSPSSDLYSLGCLFWETVTGQPPYTGADVDVAMAHLQAPMPVLPGRDEFTVRANDVIARTMAKDPHDRYRTALELRDDLRLLTGGTSGIGGAVGATASTGGARRGRLLVAAGAAVVVLAGGGVAAVVLTGGDDDPSPRPGAAAPTYVTGDLDDDGFGDVAVATLFGSAELFRSDGEALGQTPEVLTDVDTSTVQADVDGDGRLETVSVALDGSAVAVRRSDGTVVRSDLTPGEGENTSDLVAGDFDGDGYADVAALRDSGEGRLVEVLGGAADATFSPATTFYDGPFDAVGTVALDVDDDGDDDLVAISGNVVLTALVLTADDGSFTLGQPQELDVELSSAVTVSAADLDGDGRRELVAVSTDEGIHSWTTAGDGFGETRAWSSALPDRLGFRPDVLATDLDGDRDDDLVLMNSLQGDDDAEGRVVDLVALISDGDRIAPADRWGLTGAVERGAAFVGASSDRD